MVLGPEALSLVTLAAAVLVAAKAHGRQVRLEREAAGFHDVDFGGANPPWVEALWRKDRTVYWVAFALVGTAMLAALLRGAVPMPVREAQAPHVGVQLAVAFGWALLAGFVAAGGASLLRSRRSGALGRNLQGTVAWWLLAAGAAAANLAAGFLPA